MGAKEGGRVLGAKGGWGVSQPNPTCPPMYAGVTIYQIFDRKIQIILRKTGMKRRRAGLGYKIHTLLYLTVTRILAYMF